MACRDGTVYPIGEECNRSWDYDCAISTKTVSFDRASLIVEGQTRGEWVSLGTHTMSKGIGGQIRFISEEPDLHADAVLFVKK